MSWQHHPRWWRGVSIIEHWPICPSGDLAEVDRAASELGRAEVDHAGEHGATEVSAVEDNTREVEVQALPGHRRARLEVRGNDPVTV